MADLKIHDVNSLDRAIANLELKKKLLEIKLEDNANHLQENFMSMAFKSAVPKTNFESGPFAAAGNFLKSDKLKDGFTTLVSSVTEIATESIGSLINKLKGRKDNDPGS